MIDTLNNQNYHAMRILKRSAILSSAILIATILLNFTNSYALDGNLENDMHLEATEMELMEVFEITNFSLSVEDKVEVYDQDNNLIAFGNPEDNRIKKLIDVSDFLVESQRTKLYRLSYE